MLKTMIKCTLWLLICALSAHADGNVVDISKASSFIELNGVETTVHFNDGDTFKILDGDLKGSRARVVGINALETYGPVHEWLDNSPEYLLETANLATKMAQNGFWHCSTSGKRDTYGRLLGKCDDLSVALVSAGLAHAYSVDSKNAPKTYLRQQKIAQKNQLGMWKHGVPQYIITSLHSADEESENTYNRLISTEDGKSKLWHHDDSYGTCENVCLEDDETGNVDTCMIYVPYGNRYGRNKPDCLRLSSNS